MINLKLSEDIDFLKNENINLIQIENLKIDIDKLDLINSQKNPDTQYNRLMFCGVLVLLLSNDKFKNFFNDLDSGEKTQLQQDAYFPIFFDANNNYVKNISSSTSPFEEEYFSYLAIRNENNFDRIRELITNPDFLTSSSSIKDCFNFLTLQSLLMHNGEGIVGLQTIEGLTSEQDEKKNIVLKNVAIASLINPNLHDQAKEILDRFQSTQFNDQDKESIKNSFNFLTAQIEKSISENQDEKLLKQFDILVKNLQIYGEKLDITIEVPNKIMDAIKIRQNADLALLDPAKFPLKEGSSELIAEVLLGDNQKDIINLSVLKTLKDGARIGGASASLVSNNNIRAQH
jgi:hypothetical protein